MRRGLKNLNFAVVGIFLALSATNSRADYSEEFVKCMSVPNRTEDTEYMCLKAENEYLLKKMAYLKKELENQGVFAQLISQGNTLDKQLENYKLYVYSHCHYSASVECPIKSPKAIEQDCIFGFMDTLAKDWENMLLSIRKRKMIR